MYKRVLLNFDSYWLCANVSKAGTMSEAARAFIGRPGSLKELNFMPGLRCSETPGVLSGHLFTGKVVRGGKGWVPAVKKFGAWQSKLTVIIRALMCAYRLRRPSNLVEAFHPLSPGELKVLESTHRFWEKNLEACFEDADFDQEAEHATIGEECEWAYRLAAERSKTFHPLATPVIIDACGTRDPYEYGTLALNGLDTNHVIHTRRCAKLLENAMPEGSSSLTPVVAVLKKCHGLFKEARNGRTGRDADINGAVGKGRKERRNRFILLADSVDRQFTLLMAWQLSLCEKQRPMMEAILRHCPDFDLLAATCLVDAETGSTSFERVLDPGGDGTRSVKHVVGEDHLLGKTPEKIRETKAWVDAVVEGLENEKPKPFTCQDWSRFSVVTMLGCNFNSACLRQGAALYLDANTSYYKNQRGRLSMRPPPITKVSKKMNRTLSSVQKEHEIHGAQVVRWCMAMNLVGRAFLRKHNGAVDDLFGPLGSNGKKLSDDVYGRVFEECGRAYFGVDNADIYALRSVQDTTAARDLLAVGASSDHPAVMELCKEQQTGTPVSKVSYCIWFKCSVLGSCDGLLGDDPYEF